MSAAHQYRAFRHALPTGVAAAPSNAKPADTGYADPVTAQEDIVVDGKGRRPAEGFEPGKPFALESRGSGVGPVLLEVAANSEQTPRQPSEFAP